MKKQLFAIMLLTCMHGVQQAAWRKYQKSQPTVQPSGEPTTPTAPTTGGREAAPTANAGAGAQTVTSADALVAAFPADLLPYVLQGAIEGSGVQPQMPSTQAQIAAGNAGKEFVSNGSATIAPAGQGAQSKKLGRLGRK